MSPPDEQEERGQRILLAQMLLSDRLDRHVSLAEFGELIARKERRPDAYSASSVSRMQAGENDPSLSACIAICEVVNDAAKETLLDPGWLAFGPRTSAKGPKSPTITLGMLAQQRAGGRRQTRKRKPR